MIWFNFARKKKNCLSTWQERFGRKKNHPSLFSLLCQPGSSSCLLCLAIVFVASPKTPSIFSSSHSFDVLPSSAIFPLMMLFQRLLGHALLMHRLAGPRPWFTGLFIFGEIFPFFPDQDSNPGPSVNKMSDLSIALSPSFISLAPHLYSIWMWVKKIIIWNK